MVNCTPNARGFATMVIDAHADKLRYVMDTDRFFRYDGIRWAECNAQNVEIMSVIGVIHDHLLINEPDDKVAQQLVKLAGSATGVSSIVRLMKADRRIWANLDDFSRKPYLLNFPNGTLNLREPRYKGDDTECNFRNHDPADMLTTAFPVEYHPYEIPDTPLWTAMLMHMCGGDESLVFNLEQALAYGLYGANPEQMAVFLVGESNIGKTQALEIITELAGTLGGHGKIELIMKTHGSEHDSLRSDLRGRHFVMLGEAGNRLRLDELKFKDLTGSKFLPTRKLGQEQVSTRVTWTLYTATNELPEIHGSMDDAVARRLWIFELPGKQIPKNQQDSALTEKIIHQEGAHIVQRLAIRLMEWYGEGMPVTRHSACVQALDKYRTESDTVQLFCTIMLTGDVDEHVTYDDLHEAYVNFCRKRGLTQEGRRKLPKRVADITMAERDSSNCRIKGLKLQYEAPSWLK